MKDWDLRNLEKLILYQNEVQCMNIVRKKRLIKKLI